MDCCQCQGIESVFDKKVAAKDLKRYRKKGTTGTTRALIEALKAEGLEGLTLIDIGGGIGVIQHELMDAGVASATNVDASSAYVETAREEAKRRGYADRVTYHHGNFVEMAPELAPADVVTLDKGICCYHDMDALVGASSKLAGKLYGVIYPRDTWWVKLIFRTMISMATLYFLIRRNPFRPYLHPTQAVDAVVRANGLQQRSYKASGIWQVVVYSR